MKPLLIDLYKEFLSIVVKHRVGTVFFQGYLRNEGCMGSVLQSKVFVRISVPQLGNQILKSPVQPGMSSLVPGG